MKKITKVLWTFILWGLLLGGSIFFTFISGPLREMSFDQKASFTLCLSVFAIGINLMVIRVWRKEEELSE